MCNDRAAQSLLMPALDPRRHPKRGSRRIRTGLPSRRSGQSPRLGRAAGPGTCWLVPALFGMPSLLPESAPILGSVHGAGRRDQVQGWQAKAGGSNWCRMNFKLGQWEAVTTPGPPILGTV